MPSERRLKERKNFFQIKKKDYLREKKETCRNVMTTESLSGFVPSKMTTSVNLEKDYLSDFVSIKILK